MHLHTQDMENYCVDHTTEESDLLKQITRHTHLHVLMPQMLSGHLQGAFLKMISCMIRPQRILEIGTYTGYTAICLAEGLKDDGLLYTLDINAELSDANQAFFEQSGHGTKIKMLTGDAKQILPTLQEQWDLVFIDADKKAYAHYFDQVIDHVRPGGFIIADNVLWSGKVLSEKKDSDTESIDSFNKKIQQDPRVENMLLPLRDGLLIMRKL